MNPGPRLVDRLDLATIATCEVCGAPRRTLDGRRELRLGEKCLCGAYAVRVPRQAGQYVGATVTPENERTAL